MSHLTLPFPVGEKRASTGDEAEDYSDRVGKVFEVAKGGGPQRRYRLVKANAAIASPAKKTVALSDRDTWKVALNAAAAERVAGVLDNDLTVDLDAGDWCYAHVKGPVTLITSDNTLARPTDGEYVVSDGDGATDDGKCKGGGTTFSDGKTFAVARATTTANDAEFLADIERELAG